MNFFWLFSKTTNTTNVEEKQNIDKIVRMWGHFLQFKEKVLNWKILWSELFGPELCVVLNKIWQYAIHCGLYRWSY